jgi:hypothetical protein
MRRTMYYCRWKPQKPKKNKQPELLLISTNAVNGTSSAQTFSLLLMIGGKRALALVDSGSAHTFMNY